jgi:hypothetical protein
VKGKTGGTGVTPGLAPVEEPVAAKGFPWFQTPAPPPRRNAISGRRKYFFDNGFNIGHDVS